LNLGSLNFVHEEPLYWIDFGSRKVKGQANTARKGLITCLLSTASATLLTLTRWRNHMLLTMRLDFAYTWHYLLTYILSIPSITLL